MSIKRSYHHGQRMSTLPIMLHGAEIFTNIYPKNHPNSGKYNICANGKTFALAGSSIAIFHYRVVYLAY